MSPFEEYLRDLAEWSPLLLKGLGTTLLVTATTMVLSVVFGMLLALAYIGAEARGGPLGAVIRGAIRVYVDTLRGIPLLVTLFILFYALPSAGLEISDQPLVIGILGFTLNITAYLTEVFRAAILSVDRGQMEAALSIGMSPRTSYRRIVLPQAMLVAVPTVGGYAISALKDSSILGFVAVLDLMRTGILLVTTTFKSFEIYFTIGFIYLVLSLLAAFGVRRIERRLTPAFRRHVARPGSVLGEPRDVAILSAPVPGDDERRP